MIELLGIDDDFSGKSKMQRTIVSKMVGDENEARTCLEQRLAFVTGTVPHLEEVEQTPVASGVKTDKQSSDGVPKQIRGWKRY